MCPEIWRGGVLSQPFIIGIIFRISPLNRSLFQHVSGKLIFHSYFLCFIKRYWDSYLLSELIQFWNEFIFLSIILIIIRIQFSLESSYINIYSIIILTGQPFNNPFNYISILYSFYYRNSFRIMKIIF